MYLSTWYLSSQGRSGIAYIIPNVVHEQNSIKSSTETLKKKTIRSGNDRPTIGIVYYYFQITHSYSTTVL